LEFWGAGVKCSAPAVRFEAKAAPRTAGNRAHSKIKASPTFQLDNGCKNLRNDENNPVRDAMFMAIAAQYSFLFFSGAAVCDTHVF